MLSEDIVYKLRDESFPLTDYGYSPSTGLYCRFGAWPVAVYRQDWWGGLYMAEVRNDKPMNPITESGSSSWGAVRVPVGFEIKPGMFPGYDKIARQMKMPVEVVQQSCELMLYHGHGTCTSAWSVKA